MSTLTRRQTAAQDTHQEGLAALWSPTTAVTALTVLSLGLRLWVAMGGWFYLDDYVFYLRTRELSVTDPALLLTAYNSHFMPGSMLWVSALSHLAPLSFGPVVLVSLGVQLAIDVAMYLLLRQLIGLRPALVLPYAVFVLTSITLPAMVWWAAALNQLPQQLFTLLALLAVMHHFRSGRVRYAVLAALSVTAGLAFSEKTALAIPLAVLVAWFFLTPGPLRTSWRETLRRGKWLWAALLVVALGYVAVYVANVPSLSRRGAKAGQGAETLSTAVTRTVVPGLFGGPWRWDPWGIADGLADPPVMLRVASLVVLAIVIVVAARARPVSLRGWFLVLLWTTLNAALIWATRVATVGVDPVAAEYRYFTDVAIVGALAVAVSVAPVRGVARVDPEPRRDPATGLRLVAGQTPAVLGALLVVALVASSIVSAIGFRERWSANTGRAYFEHAEATLAKAPRNPVVYNGTVPDAVVWRLLWPATLPTRLLAPRGADLRVLGKDVQSTTVLWDFGPDGAIRRSQVKGLALRLDGIRDCTRVGASPVTIPLEGKAVAWDWVLQLTVAADTDGQLTVTTPSGPVTAQFTSADTTVYVQLKGEYESITLSATDGAGLCVRSGTVGLPQPLIW